MYLLYIIPYNYTFVIKYIFYCFIFYILLHVSSVRRIHEGPENVRGMYYILEDIYIYIYIYKNFAAFVAFSFIIFLHVLLVLFFINVYMVVCFVCFSLIM